MPAPTFGVLVVTLTPESGVFTLIVRSCDVRGTPSALTLRSTL
jgi:hypothetical protein